MNELPVLFPIPPSEFWQQLKIIVEDVVEAKLKQGLEVVRQDALPNKALLKITEVCSVFYF